MNKRRGCKGRGKREAKENKNTEIAKLEKKEMKRKKNGESMKKGRKRELEEGKGEGAIKVNRNK